VSAVAQTGAHYTLDSWSVLNETCDAVCCVPVLSEALNNMSVSFARNYQDTESICALMWFCILLLISIPISKHFSNISYHHSICSYQSVAMVAWFCLGCQEVSQKYEPWNFCLVCEELDGIVVKHTEWKSKVKNIKKVEGRNWEEAVETMREKWLDELLAKNEAKRQKAKKKVMKAMKVMKHKAMKK
jgi:hypothetical protein